jgi:predicted metal-binding protein
MSRPIKPPYTVRQVLVCTNLRDPSTGKPSCGLNGANALRDRLKKTVKERGLKGRLMVTGTSCLDICPAQGGVVVYYPENDWQLTETEPEVDEAILARALEGGLTSR